MQLCKLKLNVIQTLTFVEIKKEDWLITVCIIFVGHKLDLYKLVKTEVALQKNKTN